MRDGQVKQLGMRKNTPAPATGAAARVLVELAQAIAAKGGHIGAPARSLIRARRLCEGKARRRGPNAKRGGFYPAPRTVHSTAQCSAAPVGFSPEGGTTWPPTESPSGPAVTDTTDPSSTSPERISSASGSCRLRWITRLSGRAP